MNALPIGEFLEKVTSAIGALCNLGPPFGKYDIENGLLSRLQANEVLAVDKSLILSRLRDEMWRRPSTLQYSLTADELDAIVTSFGPPISPAKKPRPEEGEGEGEGGAAGAACGSLQATMSTPPVSVLAEVIFGWSGQPVEVYMAACESGDRPDVCVCLSKTFGADHVKAAASKHVLLLGTYWTPEDVKSVACIAARVTVAVYSPADVPKYEGTGAVVVGLWTKDVPVNWDEFGSLYTSALRSSGVIPGGAEADMHLRRGLQALSGSKGVFPWLAEYVREGGDIREIIDPATKAGVLIVTNDAANAALAATHGCRVRLGALTAWVIVGPVTPVQPYTDAAAKEAAAHGCALGINLRYSLSSSPGGGKGPQTMLSFKAAEGTDPAMLDFLRGGELKAGGPPGGALGVTVKHLVPVPEEGQVLGLPL